MDAHITDGTWPLKSSSRRRLPQRTSLVPQSCVVHFSLESSSSVCALWSLRMPCRRYIYVHPWYSSSLSSWTIFYLNGLPRKRCVNSERWRRTFFGRGGWPRARRPQKQTWNGRRDGENVFFFPNLARRKKEEEENQGKEGDKWEEKIFFRNENSMVEWIFRPHGYSLPTERLGCSAVTSRAWEISTTFHLRRCSPTIRQCLTNAHFLPLLSVWKMMVFS